MHLNKNFSFLFSYLHTAYVLYLSWSSNVIKSSLTTKNSEFEIRAV